MVGTVAPGSGVRAFRTRVSPELGRLIKQSPAVARQFIPDPREAEPYGGTAAPFEEGRQNRGIYGLERLYADRAVLTPYFDCSAYCRYCFKKARTLAGDGRRMTEQDLDDALAFIGSDPRITTTLITGGDPFADPALLFSVLDRVMHIPHVTNVRIGTRNILFDPRAVTDDFADRLASYNRVDYEDLRRSKNVTVGVSLNHRDELTPAVARAAHTLVQRGIGVRGQVALLKGINDSAHALKDLIGAFLCIGIVPYYLLHCMPVVGAKHFRTSVQKGLDMLTELLPFSGVTAPLYVYVTPVGKIRLSPGQRVEYVTEGGMRYIRAVTPYRAADFFDFTGKTTLPLRHSVNADGYIVSEYLDGDDTE